MAAHCSLLPYYSLLTTQALLLDLWDAARPHTLFLVKDQGWVEERALALLERERPGGVASCVVPRAEGVRSAAHDSDGLFLLKTKMQPEARPEARTGLTGGSPAMDLVDNRSVDVSSRA